MSDARRGSIVVVVLLLLAIGVVMASGVLASSDAAATVSQSELTKAQVRALAWSGVQAAMSELSAQRDEILAGGDPMLTEEWSLYSTDSGERGVVRLVDLSPDDPSMPVVSENAKLDLNHATEEMLAALPGLDAVTVGAILEARARGPFSSVESLLGVGGVDASSLYGSIEEPPTGLFAPPGAANTAAPDLGAPLAAMLTAFSFDPNVQSALDGRDEFRGEPRVNINREWSDSLRDEIAARLDEGAAEFVRRVMEGGARFRTDGELAAFLASQGGDVSAWADVFDVFATTDDAFLPGRLDINRARAEVLACVPGIGPDLAQRLLDARSSLSPEERRSVVWPLVAGVLSADEMAEAVGHLTTRSTQWRVRIEAGIEPAPAGGGRFDESVPITLDQLTASFDEPETEPTLRHRMVFEAVIDIGSTRPRVAYLREVTLLDPVRRLLLADASEAGSEGSDEPGEEQVEPEARSREPLASGPAAGAADTEPSDVDTPRDEAEDDPRLASGGDTAPREAPDRRIGRWSTRKGGSE